MECRYKILLWLTVSFTTQHCACPYIRASVCVNVCAYIFVWLHTVHFVSVCVYVCESVSAEAGA